MTRRRIGWSVVGLCLIAVPPAAAQSLYGQIDFVLDRANTTFGGTKGFNRLFTQAYTIGYQSVLADPRVGTFLAEATFLRSDMNTSVQTGYSKNFGYDLGVNLFPNRPFPFSISASRTAGTTSPDFAGLGFASGTSAGVPLPPGYVPDLYSTTLSTLDMNWALVLPSWPLFHLNYRRDSAVTSTGPYEGTENNRYLTAALEKDWSRVRNQLTYSGYAGEANTFFPLDRSQRELLYNLTADLTEKVRANGRAGFRDISSSFTFASTPGTPSPGTPTPPVLSNDLTSSYASGGATYEPTGRLGFDVQTGYELLEFDRNGSPASTDVVYTVGSARYLLFEGLSVTGNGSSSLRSETLGGTSLDARQQSVGGGVSYTRRFGIIQPVAGIGGSVGRTETLDGQSGDTGSLSRQAGIAATPGHWFSGMFNYEDTEGTDDVFSLGNYTRRRWSANGQSQPNARLRIDGTWERTNLDQGLGIDRLISDYRLGQAGATWQINRSQNAGGRFGRWRTESGATVVDTTYGVLSYVGYFGALRARADFVRDDVDTETGRFSSSRVTYRIQGFLEYRLRLFLFGFDYRYANNAEVGLDRYVDNQWRIRVGRRFGAAFR